jgi:CRP/FNR family transcriptional regulator, cyclic AMP receptor protein
MVESQDRHKKRGGKMKRTDTRAMQDRRFTVYRERSQASDWAKVLATFPLFAGVSRRELRKLAREATFVEFAPGDIVMSNPESSEWLHVILSGSARVIGKPAARSLRTGDYYGELALLENGPRSATVVAAEELHVMRLPRHSFLRLAQDHSAVTFRMLRNLGAQFRRLEAQAMLAH